MSDIETEPTPRERASFVRHAKALAKLGRKGLHIYLAMDSLHLMSGPSHDEKLRPRQDRVRESVTIPRAGGGDW